MKKKIRINWKQVLLYVLISALSLAALAGIGSLFNRDTKTIGAGVFSVGALDQNGRYVESDLSIFTEDLIECKGLCIEPDFKNVTGTFQVFYYGEDKAFIGATEVLNAADGVYTRGDDFGEAVYCRIMITPAVPTDDEGNEVEDYKIRFWNVRGIANDYTITVDKDQTAAEVKNLFVADASMKGYNWMFEAADEIAYKVTADGEGATKLIDVTDISELTIKFNGEAYATEYLLINGTKDLGGQQAPTVHGGQEYTFSENGTVIEIPEGVTGIYFNYKLGQEFQIIASK